MRVPQRDRDTGTPAGTRAAPVRFLMLGRQINALTRSTQNHALDVLAAGLDRVPRSPVELLS
jgi:hypothetical protein